MSTINMVSQSGGKDSTATLLLAIARDEENIQSVFADTSNEHEIVYEYLDYLERATGIRIERIKADFSRQIAGKRAFVETKWREHGVPEDKVKRALEALKPTGIPFLDLCIWKGRFPSSQRAFCSEELKRNPIIEHQMQLLDAGHTVMSWQGVRANESRRRRHLPELDQVGGGLWNYRPILRWRVEDVFEAHRYMGIKPNPLYTMGMGRVGCMPCINVRKDELLEISKRFPEEIERLAEWERLVAEAAKRDSATFFTASDFDEWNDEMTDEETFEVANVFQRVEWAKTSRGGKQRDMFRELERPSCSSIYGLCE